MPGKVSSEFVAMWKFRHHIMKDCRSIAMLSYPRKSQHYTFSLHVKWFGLSISWSNWNVLAVGGTLSVSTLSPSAFGVELNHSTTLPDIIGFIRTFNVVAVYLGTEKVSALIQVVMLSTCRRRWVCFRITTRISTFSDCLFRCYNEEKKRRGQSLLP